jgi:hypothetical protein
VSRWRHARAAARAGRGPFLATATIAALLAAAGCTATRDLVADQPDATTTSVRVPARAVPHRVTTTTTAAPSDAGVAAATTTVVPPPAKPARPATKRSGRSTTPTTLPLSALLAALRNATATTRPPTPTTSTTTTIISANPDDLVVTAQNPLVHQGETQTISIQEADDPDSAPDLVRCAGRDYRISPNGIVAAGFATTTACGFGAGTTLTRTLPADIPYGQYLFCTEVRPTRPQTVCTFYVAVAYPT